MIEKNFVLVGAAGYIAPRHLEAIKSLGQNLIAAYDVNDSVGILDRYFPKAAFFNNITALEAYLEVERSSGKSVDYVSICSPNDLHASQIEWAFRMGANAICEKPIVLTVNEVAYLQTCESRFGKRAFTVLQLRVHEAILNLRSKIESEKLSGRRYQISLQYVTSRGPWYHQSWKGQIERSGGLSSNIGVHFFDVLTWIFGQAKKNELLERTRSRERGRLELMGADVDWMLSIDSADLPLEAVKDGKSTFRSLKINGQEFEFSDGFSDLHTTVYRNILAGNGFGLSDASNAVAIVEQLRAVRL